MVTYKSILRGAAKAAIVAGGLVVPHQADADDVNVSLILDNNFNASNASQTHFSTDRGYGVVNLNPVTPNFGFDISTGDGVQLFLSAQGRILDGSYRPDPARTRKFIDGLIPSVPTMESMLKDNINPMLYDFLYSGEFDNSKYTAADRKAFAAQFQEITKQLGYEVPSNLTSAILDRVPANQKVSADNLLAAMDQFLPGDQSKLVTQYNNFRDSFQSLAQTDTRGFISDTFYDSFNAPSGGTGQVLEGMIKAGLRADIYNNGVIKFGTEAYLGVAAQNWNVPGLEGTCTKIVTGANAYAEARIAQGFSLGAKAGIDSNLPCSFGADNVVYSEQLYNFSVNGYLKYTFGAQVDAPAQNSAFTNPLEGWEASLFTGTYFDDPSINMVGEDGFSTKTFTRSAIAGTDISRNLISAGAFYLDGGMQVSGALTRGIIAADQGRMLEELERRLPAGEKLSDDFLKRAGFSKEYLEKIGINPGLYGNALRQEIIDRAMKAHGRPDQKFEGYEINMLGRLNTGVKFQGDVLTTQLYTGVGIGARFNLESIGNQMHMGVAPMASVTAGAKIGLVNPPIGDEASLFVEGGFNQIFPGVTTGTRDNTTSGYNDISVKAGLTLKF